jgi:membrane dipeptidase
MPGFLTEAERADLELRDKEKDRLEKVFPDSEAKVESGLVEWRKAHAAPPPAKLSDVADHIDYIRKVAGIDHVGIGSDFDGFRGPPEDLEDVSCYPALLAELMRRGYTRADIKKVAGLNLLRVMRAAEKVAVSLRTK